MTSVVDSNLDTMEYAEPNGSGGARTDGSGTPGGTPPSPVPPAPILGVNVDPKVSLEQYKQAKQRRRQERKQQLRARLSNVDRSYYMAAAGLGVCVLGFLGVRSLLGMQRDTALALADRTATTPAVADTAPAEQVVVQGIPNPLADLKLTGQARWIIGEVGGELPPARSAAVVTALLDQVELCDVYLGLNDRAAVVVSFEPTPGFSPLIQCKPGIVEVPQDLAPPTTVAPAAAS
jgi:hypothetical protein